MSRSLFRELLSIEEVRSVLKKSLSLAPLGTEQVPLSEAYNRVLAREVKAWMDVPPFHRSTVDGYAVKAEDTFGADEGHPIQLRFCGQVFAGEAPSIILRHGEAAEIVTGAPLPHGANAVVMVEHTVRKDDNVMVYRAVSKWENVMKTGSDIRKGETVFGGGRILSPREIGVLAALGFTRVEVFKKPKVAVLSTGVEVVEPGSPLPPGKIYDINTYSLSAAVEECGGEAIPLGIIPDDINRIESVLREALKLADLVVTSGGVSVGPTDIIPQVLNSLGEPGVIVCGIKSKPGKPTTIAVVDGKPVFSLPGHPTSSLLMFYLFVQPVIQAMAGRQSEEPYTVEAYAETKMFPARGRRTFVMVKLTRSEPGRWLASPVPIGLSGAITTLAKADGFVEIPEERQFINAGEKVIVRLFGSPRLLGRRYP